MSIRLPERRRFPNRSDRRISGKLVEQLSTSAIVQHDAETRFRALAARGSVEAGLRILDKLDDSFPEKTSDTVVQTDTHGMGGRSEDSVLEIDGDSPGQD